MNRKFRPLWWWVCLNRQWGTEKSHVPWIYTHWGYLWSVYDDVKYAGYDLDESWRFYKRTKRK